MTHETPDFYDSLADYYHLIFEDWDRSIHRQAAVLNALISHELSYESPWKILDCACGIGTQALGFASLGHKVVASDLSMKEIQRAQKEAQFRSLRIDFKVADMTNLIGILDDQFDAVAALDNAVPHLTPGQLIQAIGAMASRLKPGGVFIASIRDYNELLRQRPAMQEPSFFGDEGNRRIVHQVWDWDDGAKYKLHLYISLQAAPPQWKTLHFVTEYRAVQRSEVSEALRAAGFDEPIWLMPKDSGYYQPIVMAKWPAKSPLQFMR